MARDADDEEIEEQAKHFFRLMRQTMTEGTNAVRSCVLERLPDRLPIHVVLEQQRRTMEDLWKRKIITDAQMNILFPVNRNADLSRIDITLWIILLRNLVPASSVGRINWNRLPTDDDNDWFHDSIRIREKRKSLFHCNKPEIDPITFERQWDFIARALNVNVDTDAYRNADTETPSR